MASLANGPTFPPANPPTLQHFVESEKGKHRSNRAKGLDAKEGDNRMGRGRSIVYLCNDSIVCYRLADNIDGLSIARMINEVSVGRERLVRLHVVRAKLHCILLMKGSDDPVYPWAADCQNVVAGMPLRDMLVEKQMKGDTPREEGADLCEEIEKDNCNWCTQGVVWPTGVTCVSVCTYDDIYRLPWTVSEKIA